MVKITIKPWQEIVIHEVIEHTVAELVAMKATGARLGGPVEPLLWTDGVVFMRTSMPVAPDVIREQLQGILHFSSVEWALMPEYKSYLATGEVNIPVIDASKTIALKDMVSELKKLKKIE
jgi:hypothetical protein